MSGFTSELDPVASDGNWISADFVFEDVHQRRSFQIATKKIIIKQTPPVTPPAIAPTFVRDPPPLTEVKVAGGGDHVLLEVVDDGVPATGRRDDSVPLVRWASVMLKVSPSWYTSAKIRDHIQEKTMYQNVQIGPSWHIYTSREWLVVAIVNYFTSCQRGWKINGLIPLHKDSRTIGPVFRPASVDRR